MSIWYWRRSANFTVYRWCGHITLGLFTASDCWRNIFVKTAFEIVKMYDKNMLSSQFSRTADLWAKELRNWPNMTLLCITKECVVWPISNVLTIASCVNMAVHEYTNDRSGRDRYYRFHQIWGNICNNNRTPRPQRAICGVLKLFSLVMRCILLYFHSLRSWKYGRRISPHHSWK